MHVKTHQALAIAIYDALPRAAQDFLRQSDVELRQEARVPDEVAGDNILSTGCESGVESYAHSFKMELQPDGTLKHIRGSAPTVIAEAPREVRNAIREQHYDEARRIMVRAFAHYAVDCCTPWHLTHELTSTDHRLGEEQLARSKTVIPTGAELVTASHLVHPKSLYESAVAAAEESYRQFVAPLKDLQAHGKVTDDPVLAKAIVHHAGGFGLAVALYIWHWAESA